MTIKIVLFILLLGFILTRIAAGDSAFPWCPETYARTSSPPVLFVTSFIEKMQCVEEGTKLFNIKIPVSKLTNIQNSYDLLSKLSASEPEIFAKCIAAIITNSPQEMLLGSYAIAVMNSIGRYLFEKNVLNFENYNSFSSAFANVLSNYLRSAENISLKLLGDEEVQSLQTFAILDQDLLPELISYAKDEKYDSLINNRDTRIGQKSTNELLDPILKKISGDCPVAKQMFNKVPSPDQILSVTTIKRKRSTPKKSIHSVIQKYFKSPKSLWRKSLEKMLSVGKDDILSKMEDLRNLFPLEEEDKDLSERFINEFQLSFDKFTPDNLIGIAAKTLEKLLKSNDFSAPDDFDLDEILNTLDIEFEGGEEVLSDNIDEDYAFIQALGLTLYSVMLKNELASMENFRTITSVFTDQLSLFNKSYSTSTEIPPSEGTSSVKKSSPKSTTAVHVSSTEMPSIETSTPVDRTRSKTVSGKE